MPNTNTALLDRTVAGHVRQGEYMSDVSDVMKPITTLTPIQFRRALALAYAHGHMWALAPTTWEYHNALAARTTNVAPLETEVLLQATALVYPEDLVMGDDARNPRTAIDIATIDSVTRAGAGPNWNWIGIAHPHMDADGVHRHTTGTCRLSWIVERDGCVTLTVARPSRPDGPREAVPVLVAVLHQWSMTGDEDLTVDRVGQMSISYRHVQTMVAALSALGIQWDPDIDAIGRHSTAPQGDGAEDSHERRESFVR